MPYLSASVVVIHYEEALYQVYHVRTSTFTLLDSPPPLGVWDSQLHWLSFLHNVKFQPASVVVRHNKYMWLRLL